MGEMAIFRHYAPKRVRTSRLSWTCNLPARLGDGRDFSGTQLSGAERRPTGAAPPFRHRGLGDVRDVDSGLAEG